MKKLLPALLAAFAMLFSAPSFALSMPGYTGDVLAGAHVFTVQSDPDLFKASGVFDSDKSMKLTFGPGPDPHWRSRIDRDDSESLPFAAALRNRDYAWRADKERIPITSAHIA